VSRCLSGSVFGELYSMLIKQDTCPKTASARRLIIIMAHRRPCSSRTATYGRMSRAVPRPRTHPGRGRSFRIARREHCPAAVQRRRKPPRTDGSAGMRIPPGPSKQKQLTDDDNARTAFVRRSRSICSVVM
jgi:hypothetical protein